MNAAYTCFENYAWRWSNQTSSKAMAGWLCAMVALRNTDARQKQGSVLVDCGEILLHCIEHPALSVYTFAARCSMIEGQSQGQRGELTAQLIPRCPPMLLRMHMFSSKAQGPASAAVECAVRTTCATPISICCAAQPSLFSNTATLASASSHASSTTPVTSAWTLWEHHR